MKQILTFIAFFFLVLTLNAQNIAINSDGSAPNASAMLDIKSSSKGILIPRLDSNSRKAIAVPADGLMVYDTDTKSMWIYMGGTSMQWKELQVVNKNFFLAYRSADILYTPGGSNIPFDVVTFDDGNVFNTSLGGRFVAPETGVYHFDAGVTDVNAGSNFQLSVYKVVGGSPSRLSTTFVRPASTTFPVTTNISYTVRLNKNDGVAIWMEPGVGNVTVKGGTDQSWFSGYRVY